MPPISKQLTAHIGFGLCVRASVRASVRSSRTVHARVLKFHIWIPHRKIADTCFFSCPSYLPIWSYAPLKKSEWNLTHAISYDPCMLGFWNFIYMYSSWNNSWLVFFLVRVLSLSEVRPLWKNQNEILSARYLKKVFELGAWNLVSYKGMMSRLPD